jgi:carboxymethylenebutenolidase
MDFTSGRYEVKVWEEEIPVSGGGELPVYLAMPVDDSRQYPGVVVLQEVFGVNEYIKEMTRRIAELGCVAIAPSLFYRQVADFSVGYSAAELAAGRVYATGSKATELLGDIQVSIDRLKALPSGCQSFAAVGFCYGGHVAYLAATLADIDYTASFYGRGISEFTFGGGNPTIDRTPAIRGEIDLFFGLDDASIPEAHIDAIELALRSHDISHRIFRYANAGHGFHCWLRDSYEPNAAATAWQIVSSKLSNAGK